jgi:hypothetical protein
MPMPDNVVNISLDLDAVAIDLTQHPCHKRRG